MVPFGLMLSILAWAAFAMSAVGLFFWAARWFPRQLWFARALLISFVIVALLARATKWAIPLFVLGLVCASSFIPRRR